MSDDNDVRPDTAASAARLWRDGAPVYDRGDTVCVVGAGGSGLTAIKNLREVGFAVDCYERETTVGGGWNWRHDRSPVYASTHLVSSKPTTQFPDFPMPDDWPDYPHHAQLLAYLERYADHFGLREHIWFGTEVARAEPVDDKWDVTVRGSRGGEARTLRYAAVVVANGHNWSPRWPEYDGFEEFRGHVLHASTYKDAAQLRGRKVLVVGGGNTGADIAVEAAQQADRCWHSTRRGHWWVPKYLLGRPTDQAGDVLRWLRVPLFARRWLVRVLLRATVGLPADRPAERLFATHPVLNSQLAYHVRHGSVAPVPAVARFHRHAVELTDGSTVEPDVVVFATGYRPTFEFVPDEVLGIGADGRPRLRAQLFSRTHPTLAVAGLVEPDGGLFSVAHWQTVAIARWLRLRSTAPERAAALWTGADKLWTGADKLWTGAGKDREERDKAGPGFEVDHVRYLRALQRTLDRLEVAA